MINKFYFGIIFMAFVLVSANFVFACPSAPDSKFTLNIMGLEVNQNKLLNLCATEKCIITDDYVSIKSTYDSKIVLIFYKKIDVLGVPGLSVKFPYKPSVEPVEIPGQDPEEYNWQDSVKTDLTYLNNLSIINIDSDTINKISYLADNKVNVFYCGEEWQKGSPTSRCIGGSLSSAKCIGSAFLPIFPDNESNETSLTYIYWIVGIFIVVVLIIYFVKRKK